MAEYSIRLINFISQKGWVPIPLDGKKPISKGWTDYNKDQGVQKCMERLYVNNNETFAPNLNIGVVCGIQSNIFVLDIDVKNNGLVTWERILRENMGDLVAFGVNIDIFTMIDTFITRTGGGGYHYYFNYHKYGNEFNNQVNILPGIDIRSQSGQVVAPYSQHPDTFRFYEPVTPEKTVKDMPIWLYNILIREVRSKTTRTVVPGKPKIKTTIPNTPVFDNTEITIPNTTAIVSDGVVQVAAPPATRTQIECITIALGILSDEYADNYERWTKVLFALKSFSNESNQDQLLQLWHDFSARSNKYSAKECERIWHRTLSKENGISIASLYFWAKECDPSRYAEAFPRQTMSLNVLKELPPYNPKENYYWYDYVKEFDGKEYIVDIGNENEADVIEKQLTPIILEELRQKIARCTRVIVSSGDKHVAYYKANDKELFHCELLPVYMTHNRYRLNITVRWVTEEGQALLYKSKIIHPSIYYPLYKCRDIRCNKIDFIPYHEDQQANLPPSILNIFPGFNAKLIAWTQDRYAIIEPILKHIFIVWANNNLEYYKWLLQWLRYPIVHLTKTQKVLILKGKQGCGKTFIFEFLRDYVYSRTVATIVSSFDDILCRFNGMLMGKLLIMIDETASVSEGSMTKKEQNKFKAMVTGNTIHIEQKGREVVELPNHLTFGIGTNSDHCADLEKGSRREGVFECNDVYVGNEGYFTEVINNISNQNTGDVFYTYLRMIDDIHPPVDGVPYLPNIQNVPDTDIKRDLIDMSRSKASLFFDGILDGSIHIPIELFHIEPHMVGIAGNVNIDNFIHNNNYYYILRDELYELVYKPWHKNFSTGSPWSGKAFNDHLLKYDKINIVGGRKRTTTIDGYTVYFSPLYLQRIIVNDTKIVGFLQETKLQPMITLDIQ
jgi:Bifunctional DNA primase/polymerase, N-terminal/Primase C terminal 2 (PriCT-2)/Family of unknown function (DUF5906)